MNLIFTIIFREGETETDKAQIIKESVPIIELIHRYGFYENRAGFICCPIHGERTPSLKVYKKNNSWHCFGCGKGSSVIDFVMAVDNLSFSDACKKIDADFGLGLYKKMSFAETRKIKKQQKKKREEREEQQRKEDFDFNCRKILSKYHCWIWMKPEKTKEMMFDLEFTERLINSESLLSINPYSLTTALSTKHTSGGEWIDILERDKGI